MCEKWYRRVGNGGDVIVSTRIRLARNLSGYPFPSMMTDQQREEVAGRVREAAEQIGGLKLHCVDLASCPKRDILAMVERHLISYDFANLDSGLLLISDDERISIMINEEDHVRIQVMDSGLELSSAYELADRVDTALDERLHFAYDDRLGYLTQCPTNLGTGMRASLMLHLPALQESGVVQQLAGTVSKLGLTIRGAFGEGTQPQGAFYQMSNQVTLGISEAAAIQNLSGIAEQIVKKEQQARVEYLERADYCDIIWRSIGILKYARLLTQEEALKRLSYIRVGVFAGLVDEIDPDTVAVLTDQVRSGCLMATTGRDLAPQERDAMRADLVRETLKSV